jgi:hypothetical protein
VAGIPFEFKGEMVMSERYLEFSVIGSRISGYNKYTVGKGLMKGTHE